VRRLRFSVFEMDLETRELRRYGHVLPLALQPFSVLAELATRSGEIVSREELGALLWGDGVHVDRERGLNYCLNRIRRVLGDDARAPRFVETLPRRGYRFLADVEVVEAGVALERPVAPALRRERRVAPWLAPVAALLLALHAPAVVRRAPSALPVRGTAARAGFLSLAETYMRMGEDGSLPAHQAFPAARRAALDALAIEDAAAPLVILAALELNYEWDWAAAEAAYRRAIRLDPDHVWARVGYARLLSAAGRHGEALRMMAEAETRKPGCPVIVRDTGLTLYRARRFDDAERRFRDWATLEPSRPDAHHWLALLHHLRGDDERAVPEARRVYAVARAAPEFVARFEALPPAAAMRFYLRGSIGYLERIASEQWVTADDVARLRAALGERERALADLERAADERSPRLLPYLNDPVFDGLRTEARFVALLRRVGAVS
jgi:DNA-binding winged helix-turn-helix (wHTH) protein/Tfp pilus assembly protein PilF